MEATCDIGLIGLAVMGQNLVLNMNDHGYKAVVFNRTVSKVDEFLKDQAKGTRIIGAHSPEEMCQLLKKPRRVMLMVKAGTVVDQTIEYLLPYLEKGDIIIDAAIPWTQIPIAAPRSWPREEFYSSQRCIGRGRRCAPRSVDYAGGNPMLGPTSRTSCVPSQPRTSRVLPVATGSDQTAPVTTSRWSTTASSTGTCRSSVRPITY